jgi:hypothetical protein
MHVGFDKHGFETRNVPAEWRDIFRQASVLNAELGDETTMRFLMSNIAG